MTAQTKTQTAAAPLPVGNAGPLKTITPARVPSGALAALLAMLPDDAPAGPTVREPKWYAQASQAGLTEGQRAFLSRVGWSGIIAADGEPETYQPEARRDVRLPSAAKLRKMAKPGGLVADAMIAALSQKGSLSVVDCLAIYNGEKVKIGSIGALLNRIGRVVGFAVSLQSDGNIKAAGTAPDGFYQGNPEVETVLRSLAAESLERAYTVEPNK
jgi:hypothetical protein